jgi:PmbA protein
MPACSPAPLPPLQHGVGPCLFLAAHASYICCMDNDDLLDAVLAAAREAGADSADALLNERTSFSLTWRLGALEDLERKEAREIGLRVLVGRRIAAAATTRADLATLRGLAEDAVAAARLLPEDPWVGLADAADLAGHTADLDLVDPEEPSLDSLQAAAAAAEDAARAVPGITNSDGASASWSSGRVTLAASNGFRGTYRRTRHGVGATVLAGTGTGMQRDYEYRQATHRADLPDPASIGREAGERAARRVGPRKVATTSVPVVYAPRAAAGLVRHLASAIGGDAVASGRSFLKDRLGQKLFAPGIAIVDDPLRPRGLASRPFDGEGIAGTRRQLVDDGVLTTWLLDLATARRLGMASTGHASRSGAALGSPGATNLTLEPGPLPPEALMADIAQGFYVTELMGMGINIVTGDYSRGASGLWIEHGALAHPVSEVTIAGNLAQIFQTLVPASDLEIHGTADAPTMRVDGLTVAGT